MNTRIVEIRKNANMTQEQFAQKIGISKNYVNLIENGKKKPGDRLVSDICRKFSINENWLRTGNGQPKVKMTRSQEIGVFASEVMNLPDDSIKKRLIQAMLKLDEKELEVLVKIADCLKEGG